MKIKNICCIGAGYVGGPTMAVIAIKCPDIRVTVVDIDKEKIDLWNSKDINDIPVYEPGLGEIVKKTRDKNLFFSNDIDGAIKNSEMIFLAVNTPTKVSGKGAGMASDLTFVEKSARKIASIANSHKIVIEKSTLPVRTAEKIIDIFSKSKNKFSFDVLSNPEFLAEGTAIKDLYKSDRVLIGGQQTKSGQNAIQSLVNIYKKWIPEDKILTVNVWSAELSKLASNAMLAQRISSINSFSALCDATGAKIDEVSNAIGRDKRIGDKFLKVSPGFGGSCFQKDILNLVYLCQYYGLEEVADYWIQVLKINDYQRLRLTNIIDSYILENKLKKTISILGWAFKANTNDSRESSSIYISYNLIERGYKLKIYDPKVSKDKILKDLFNLNIIRKKLNNDDLVSRIKIYSSVNEIIEDSNIHVVLTEWEEFKVLNDMSKNITVFDFRNYLKERKNIIKL
tara:strand:+ start:6452 stop:7813 length:1362 start_codon:yes stop_codon:yes gene_type:complete